VFAYHFKSPVPRWADEGGSVLSEDNTERERHDQLARSILNKGQQIPMRRLLSLTQYPPNVGCLYAQGYSISDYLVKRSNKQHFLNFVGHGMQYGWDHAAKSYYGHGNVDELEQAWLQHLRDTKKNAALASNVNTPASPAKGGSNFMGTSNGKTVRLTVPLDYDAHPVVRGAMPDDRSRWSAGARLEPPVPMSTEIPRLPTPAVQLGVPRP
jgi:hypothetical protein